VEPTDDEAHRKTETEDKLEPVSKSPEVGIPDFWLTALKNNALINNLINERDEEALKSLHNITASYLDDNAVCISSALSYYTRF
jgi:nucleosome assembly protein 1-like 1